MNFTIIKSVVILCGLLLTAPLSAWAEGTSDGASKYIPTIHGNIRAKYEYSTADDESRFAVRNARVKIGGYALPMVDYLVQVDFCAYGKISIMDAYVRLSPVKNLKILMGQERVPFSVDASRDLHEYYFTDLSFGAKYLGNLRSVGIKAGYTIPKTDIYVEGGIFNSSGLGDHTIWNTEMTYSIKANWKSNFGLMPQICFMSRQPTGGVRYNQTDVSLSWHNSHWFVEGEYLYCNYTNDTHAPVHAFNFFADYGFNIKSKLCQRLSFRGRYDGTTAVSTGVKDASGMLIDNYAKRQRLTAGVKTSYIHSKASLDLLLNYQHYFYPESVEGTINPAENSRIVAMVVLHF